MTKSRAVGLMTEVTNDSMTLRVCHNRGALVTHHMDICYNANGSIYKSLKGEAIERKKHGQYKEAYQNFMISRSGSVQPDDDISAILVLLQ